MKRMDQINVIPFIDVMLVLLAIVLTTATFIVEGRLPIRLPTAESQAEPAVTEPVEIAIDAAGQLYWAGEGLGMGPAALAELAPRLAALSPQTPSSCGWMPRPVSRPSSGSSTASRSRGWNG